MDMDKLSEVYTERKAARLQDIIESGGMDNEYSIKTDQGMFLLELPKRVLEQKRLLHLGQKWWQTQVFVPLPEGTDAKVVAELYHKWENEVKDNPDIGEKYITAILQYIRRNGQKLMIDEMEIGEINALAQLYWDFMLYPFSERAITVSNMILVKA